MKVFPSLEIYMGLEPHVKLGIWTNGKDIALFRGILKESLSPIYWDMSLSLQSH